MERRTTIVGVDPGTTAAWGVIGLDGEPVALGSEREAGLDTILERVVAHGRVAIVATDVHPSPETVEKVASSLNAELWVPGEDLSVEEKKEVTEEFDYGNDHERDALAAALKAWSDHLDLFDKVEKRTPPSVDTEEVKRLVVHGSTVARAVESLSEDREAEEEGEDEVERKVREETLLSRQARTIDRLRTQVEELKGELEEKEEELEEAEERLERSRSRERREAFKSDEVSRLRRKNSELREKLEEERERAASLSSKLNQSERSRIIESRGMGRVAYRLEQLTRDEASSVAVEFEVSGHPVYLDEGSGAGASGVDELDDAGVESVITGDELPHHARERLFDKGMPVVDEDALSIRRRESFVILDEDEYEEALREAEDRLQARREEELYGLIEEEIGSGEAEL